MSLGRSPSPETPTAIWLRGGDGAPARARRQVRSRLDGRAPERLVSDAATVISELVANSVVHAHVGIDEALCVELTPRADGLRIDVIDPGSEFEPRLLPLDRRSAGGFGLRVVDRLSSEWGVVHDRGGTTRVWCELALESSTSPPAAIRG